LCRIKQICLILHINVNVKLQVTLELPVIDPKDVPWCRHTGWGERPLGSGDAVVAPYDIVTWHVFGPAPCWCDSLFGFNLWAPPARGGAEQGLRQFLKAGRHGGACSIPLAASEFCGGSLTSKRSESVSRDGECPIHSRGRSGTYDLIEVTFCVR